MKNDLFRKGLVYAIVVLFIGIAIIPSIHAEVSKTNFVQKKTDNSEFGYLRLFGENLDDDSHNVSVGISIPYYFYLLPGCHYETNWEEVYSGVDVWYSILWYCDECNTEHGWIGFVYVQPGEYKEIECNIYLCDEDTTIVSIQPLTQTVEKGEAFDVEVYIEPGEPVCAVEIFKVYYDKDVITATGVTYEGFFDPYATMRMPPDLSVPGVISGIAEFTLGAETVTDPNVFCTISFTADNLGTSAIDLEEVQVLRPDGSEVPITVNDGSVTVGQPPEFFDLTISINGHGTTDPAPGMHIYIADTIVDLEAFPDTGWSFAGWSGSITTTDNPTTILMDSNKTVTATFTDIMPPEITNVLATPSSQATGGHVNITATVTDNVAVDTVMVDITSPTFATEEMTNIPDTDTYYYNTTYTEIGTYDYFIWANDTSGNANVSADYTFEIINQPPDAPSDPDPEDGATGVDVDADLSWTCSDPDGHSLTYDVYFEADDSTPDVLVSDDQTGTTYDPGTLEYETTYYWQIIAEDEYGATTDGPIWHFITEEEPVPDLDCEGSLSWTNVEPSSTVTGSFTVKNIGDPGSELDWEIIEWPDWGDWSFDPDSGTGLPDGGSETVDVEVAAPDDPNTEFTGEVKVINSNDPTDYEIIPVYLKTPVNQNSMNSQVLEFLQKVVQRFSMLE